ncbi:amino acid adenylation domain-containing protein [Rhodococcus sp. SGAir0479]|uniref:amino acid adenylation domain-containing protein n=1 Tax=Rhodococcus sp. SGAir0479 TaxID=2567884 RepID=UPI0010CCDD60|nr:non-ribosomal peptide synthetase [Rhodococcus sp. SGAir0479]QCQ91442.1 non-ribosomal peptide synthetase [Rhodococcus sp. SGAir0479]
MELPLRVDAAPGTTDAGAGLPELDGAAGGYTDPMPLTPAQAGQWLAQQLDPAVPMSVAQYVDIREDGARLHVAELSRSASRAAREFGSGLIRLVLVDSRPHQILDPRLDTETRLVDLRGEPDPEAAAHTWMRRDITVPLDMVRDRLMESALLRIADDRYLWYTRTHHIALDGVGAAAMLYRTADLYTAAVEGRPAPLGGADLDAVHAADAAYADSTRRGTDREYWVDRTSGMPERCSLAERSAPAHALGRDIGGVVDSGTAAALSAAQDRYGVSSAVLVAAALAAYTSRHTGSDDIVLSLPVSARTTAVLRRSGGTLANVVPLRISVGTCTTVAQLVTAVSAALAGALRHQRYRHEDLRRDRGDHGGGRGFSGPLLNLMLFPAELRLGATRSALEVLSSGPVEDLLVNVYRYGPSAPLRLDLKANPRLYDADTLRTHHERFRRLLHGLATAAPETPVGDLPVVDDPRAALRFSLRSGGGVTVDATLPRLVERAAARAPERVAVVSGQRRLTYRELQARSGQLARRLVTAGAGPETSVGVVLARTEDLVVALLAVVTAGAGYVPVDPTAPASRRNYVLTDAGVSCVVTTTDLATELPAAVPRLVLDDPATVRALAAESSAPVTDRDRRAPLRTGHLAYTIYTSGSTGRPKGVQVSHRSVTAMLANAAVAFGTGHGSVWALFHSFAFDFSVWEIWGALTAGGTLVVVDQDTVRTPEALVELLRREHVNVLGQTPAAFLQLADTESAAGRSLPDLRRLLVGGDDYDQSRLLPWLDRHDGGDAELLSVYGITETTVFLTGIRMNVERARAPGNLVGDAVPGLRLYLLDRRLRPVPVGVVGEIYAGGSQLARGYGGRAGPTAARFVADPFAPDGGRLYRSGDLARWDPDGHLVFLGRSDAQVQVRGFRVEPGEIESALRECPGVADAVVVPRRDDGGPVRLAAYVVPDAGTVLDPHRVRERVGGRLAPYMMPAAVTVVARLPLTVNGKVDRKALPEPDFGAGSGTGRPPSGPVEETLAALFTQVLDVESVGADDSFFALGGDSIMAIQFVSRAREAGLSLSPRDVFDRLSVAGLAAVATSAAAPPAVLEELPGGGVGRVEGTPIVRWLVERGGPYRRLSQSVCVALPTGITEPELLGAVQAVLDHHDMLRARFHADEPGFVVSPPGTIAAADVVRRSGEDARRDPAEALAAAREDAAGRLDPSSGRMLEAVWIDRGPHRPGRLLLVIHHLVVDGVSWRILLPHLASAWQQVHEGAAPQLPPVGTSMRTWAHALTAWAGAPDRAREVAYWRSAATENELPLGRRPFDPARDVAGTVAATVVELPGDVTAALTTTVPATVHGGVDDAVVTAWALALAGWRRRRGTPRATCVVTLEGHGREEQLIPGADLSRTVGWFTTTHPARLDLTGVDLDVAFGGGPDATEALKLVKEQLRGAPHHGIGYGALRYLVRPDPIGAPDRTATPEISINNLGRVTIAGAPDSAWLPVDEGGDLGSTIDPAMPAAATLDINMLTVDTGRGSTLRTSLASPTGLLDPEEVRDLAALWRSACEALVHAAGAPRAGGLTPSDVPLVRLDQDTIERLEAACPGLTDVWPLSPLQAGLLFQTEIAGDDTDPYLVQLVLDLHGAVDDDRMRRTVQALLDRHEILRAAFTTGPGGDPLQLVPGRVELPWAVADVRGSGDVAGILARDRSRRFDMTTPPLVRALLVRVADDRYQLVLTYHHILLDGWSVPLLVRELLELYAAPDHRRIPVSASFRDYLGWLDATDREASTARWVEALAGIDEPTLVGAFERGRQLPTVPRPDRLLLTEATTARLDAVARELGVTLSTVVRVAWAIVLAAWTRRDDVVFGAIVSGRPPGVAGIEDMVGLFINTVPVRVTLHPGETLAELLRRCHADQTALLGHEHVGLADIERATGAAALFDTITVFESYPIDRGGLTADTDIAGMRVADVTVHDATHYPLALAASVDTRLELRVDYAPALFDAQEIDGVVDRIERVLLAVAADPDVPLARLRLLSATDYARLAPVRGGPGRRHRTLPDILVDAARLDPDAPALSCGDDAMSYRALDARSTRTARLLIDAGLGPETVVAVAMTRSIEFVEAVWAVAKTGAAFVPVDPTYPRERIEHMLTDSGARVGLTVSSRRDALGDGISWHVVDSEAHRAAVGRRSDAPIDDVDRVAPLRTDNPAYLIYTSGSTGTPKGVALTHRGLANLVAEEREQLAVTEESKVSQFTSPSFDASVFELLMAFGSGAHLVIAPPDVVGGEDLARSLAEGGQTHAFFTPSVLGSMRPDGLGTLHALAVAGEPCPPELVGRWAPGRRMFNAYGPTEASILSNIAGPLDPDEPVTIGAPALGFVELVLDARLQPVPVGTPGELYLGGPGVARGYHRRPGLTAERFVASPFVVESAQPGDGDDGTRPGDRLYRTGDVVRWRDDLTLEYLGRSDFQVKIRGFRVELGEIDAALTDHPGVEFAATLGRTAPSGETVLVSYVRSGDDPAVDPGELRNHLGRRLPPHMVPALIVPIDDVPLTRSGKVDRKALPAPDFPAAVDATGAVAFTPLEEIVAEHLCAVLGLDRIGPDDSFFDLGGNSLTATRVTRRLDAALGADLDVRALFEAPTVRGLARRVRATGTGGAQRPALRPYDRPDVLPLSSAQLRMWSINQLDTASPAYNIVMAVRLRGALDEDALAAAVGDVMRRHSTLRTRYPLVDGTPAQVVVDPDEAPRVDRMSVGAADLPTHLSSAASTGFDVSSQVPVRAQLARLAPADHVLVVVAHHIAADGFSMTTLARDVMRAYQSRRRGQAPDWAPPPLDYVDFALWQRDLLGDPGDPGSLYSRQLAQWRSTLAGMPEVVPLPTDRPRPARQSLRGATVGFTVDAGTHRRLADLARHANATMFMVAHTALAVLVARLSDTDDIVIGTPVSGRGEAGLDEIVGMFVGMLVLRTPIDTGASFDDLLAVTRAADLTAFARTDLPFERLVDELAPERSTAYAPLFQVLVEYRTDMTGYLRLPGLEVEPVDCDPGIAKFDLQLSVSESFDPDGAPGGMRFDLTYATDLWNPATAEGFAERLHRILDAAAADRRRPVGEIGLLTAAELVAAEPGAVVPVRGDTLADLFTRAAADHPDRVALVDGESRRTYSELAADANRLARLLVARGAGPDTAVAVAVPRSSAAVVAVVATVLAGAAYLPIDVGAPRERIAFVVGEAAPTCVVTTLGAVDTLGDLPAQVVVLDSPTVRAELAAQAAGTITNGDRTAPLHPDNAAYIVYTSGSTGRPKGVEVSHRAALGLLAGAYSEFDLRASDTWTQFHSLAFDVSVWETWGPLSVGATTVIVAPEIVRSPGDFVALLQRESVTVLNQTPASFYQLVEHGADVELPLRYVFVGGEELAVEQVRKWYARRPRHTDVVAEMYGITEATVIDTTAVLAPDASTSTPPGAIGRPLPGLRVDVLDRRLQPVPAGVRGEIYVSGDAVARGYVHRPGLTAGRFVAAPGRAGRRMYRTGDLGRRGPDGRLEFLGRSDFQVQVRGFRIELGEIESAMLRCGGVARAVVVSRRDEGGADDRLVGYVVPAPGRTPDPLQVREDLARTLPPYMVPAAVVVLDALPLTSNGKVDRRALPEPDFAAFAGHGRPPAGPVEQRLAVLFAQTLGVPAVAADDSFFALGGDSITVIQLVSRARAAGLLFAPQDVFERPTVERLATVAGEAAAADRVPGLPEVAGGGIGVVEPTPVLRWLAGRRGGWEHFSQSVAVRVPADLTGAQLRMALQALLDRHDMLRSVRVGDGPDLRLAVAEPGSVDAGDCLRRVDCSHVRGEGDIDTGDIDTVASRARSAAVSRLDPAAGVMVQAVWCDAGGERPGRLAVAIHHFAVDGVSWRILLGDLVTACRQASVGTTPELPRVGTSMRTWAHELRRIAGDARTVAQLRWWREALLPADPLLGVRRFDPDRDVTASQVTIRIDAHVTHRLLDRLPQLYRATPADAVLCATAMAIARWRRWAGGLPSVVVSAEGHGREERILPGADLSRTVGWFTTTFPLRLDLTGVDIDDAYAAGRAAGTALAAVKEQWRAVPDHGIGYGLLRYLNAETESAFDDLAEPQVSVNYLGRLAGDGPAGWSLAADATVDVAGQGPVPSPLALDAHVATSADGEQLSATVRYAPDVLDADAVDEFAQLWRAAVHALAEYADRPDSGGLTPSDLGLVTATQKEIDRWESAHPGACDVWPPAPLQEGLLFHALLAGQDVDAYHVQVVLDLEGDLDRDRLAAAAQALMDRHASLRTAFDNRDDGTVVQVVLGHVDADWSVAEARDGEDRILIDREQHRNFDMRSAPLIRFLLLDVGSGRHRLVVTNHHIVLDGWSMPLLVTDLFELYVSGGRPSDRPAPQFRDYLAWLAARDTAAAERAWVTALSGLPGPTLAVPHAAGRRLSATAAEPVPVPDAVVDALARTVENAGVTVNTALQAAWGILLGQMTASADVVFGTTVSGRPPVVDGVEAMVGLFINTIPVRVRLDPREPAAQLLLRLHAARAALMAHEHLGLPAIQEAVGFGGLFDTAMVLESYPQDVTAVSRLAERTGVRVTGVEGQDSTHYPLSLMAFDDGRLRLRLRYAPEAVSPETAADLADRLVRIVEAIARRPDVPVGRVDVLGGARRAEPVAVATAEATAPRPWTDILSAGAALDPDAVALRWRGTDTTYREFDERSTRLARQLLDRGVGPEDFVPVAVPRSADSVTATWAVAKTGAAPVPIDPKLPDARVRYMLDDCAAVVGLAASRDHGLPDGLDWLALDEVDLDRGASAPIRDDERTHPIRPTDPAYLIYTSGSTGAPKGVVVTHTGLPYLAAAQIAHQNVSPKSRVLHVCSPSFDVSILELTLALAAGATLVIAPPDVYAGPELERCARDEHITHLLVTPAVCGTLDPAALPDLEVAEIGGELFGAELVDAWAHRTRLLNAYGPTECTVCVTTSETLETGRPITLGGPVPRSAVGAVVVDGWLRPVPEGGEGELYLFGPCLARGYRGQPALTSGRFVANPFGPPGSRLYRTGDLVRRAGPHGVQYVGRTDFQIKIRGLRIEVGDVDAALTAHPDVEFAASLGHRAPNGETVLVSYVRLGAGGVADAAALRKFAATSLPAYMVPSAITILDDVPMNANGKLDRRALPEPVFATVDYRPPANHTQQVLVDVFADVLGAERVGVDDSFFELGGNSLSAVRVVAEVQSRLGTALPMQWVVSAATPAAIAARLDGAEAPAPDDELVRMRGGDGTEPLVCVHPAIGLTWCYTGLLPYLGAGRPVYGIQSPGIGDKTYAPATMEELARRYVDRIRQVQPHGPYHLLGYSVGGAIAHAMAVRLRFLGEGVRTLVMLDTRTADSAPDTAPAPTLGMLFAEFAGVDGAADDGEMTAERAAQLLRDDGGPYAALTADDVRRLYDDYLHTIQLGRTYRPEQFDGDVEYVAAADDEQAPRENPWTAHVSGRVRIHPVPWTHNRLTTPDALAVVGPLVGTWLDGRR